MTLIGSQLDLILNSYIGVVFRELVDRTDSLENNGDTSSLPSSFDNSTVRNNVTSPSATGSLLEEDPIGTITLILQVALCVLLFVCSTLYGRRVLKKIVQEETEKEQTPKIAQEEMRKEQQGSLISGVREGKTSDVELT